MGSPDTPGPAIVPLRAEHAQRVAALHAAEIPASPVVRLGPGFLGRFWYPRCLADPACGGFVALDGEALAGFITYAQDRRGLFGRWLRRGWPGLAWVLAADLLRLRTTPWRIARAAWLLARMGGGPGDDVPAEVLSFAVAAPYRSPEYAARTGQRVANRLFAAAVADLARRGVARFKLETAPDSLANVFYLHHGLEELGRTARGGAERVWAGDVQAVLARLGVEAPHPV